MRLGQKALIIQNFAVLVTMSLASGNFAYADDPPPSPRPTPSRVYDPGRRHLGNLNRFQNINAGGNNNNNGYNYGGGGSSGGTISAEAPCDKPGFRSCSDYFNGESQPPASRAAKKGIIELLEKQVQNQINGYYGIAPGFNGQSVDINQSIFPDGTNSSSQTKPFGPTVCSIQKTYFTRQRQVGATYVDYSELTTDHVGKSCGSPVKIDVWRNGSRVYSRITKDDPAGQYGSLESGYIRGALMPGVACFHQIIKNEILNNKKINLDPILGSTSPCYAFAKDLVDITSQYNTKYKDAFGNTSDKLSTQANIKDIDFCEKEFDATDADQDRLRMSAQKLCAARQGLETAWAQLAVCELFARSSLHYKDRFGSASRQRAIYQALTGNVFADCQSYCRSNVSSSPSDSELTNCARTCYQKEMPEYLTTVINEEWGNPATGCNRTSQAISPNPSAQSDQLAAAAEQKLLQLLQQNTLACSSDSECVVGDAGSVCSDGATSESYVLYSISSANSTNANDIEQTLNDYNMNAAMSDYLANRAPTCSANPAPVAFCNIPQNATSGSCQLGSN